MIMKTDNQSIIDSARRQRDNDMNDIDPRPWHFQQSIR